MSPQRNARIPRALRPGEPIPPGSLAELSDAVLIEVVSRDVRRGLDPVRRAELRTPELKGRWLDALTRLVADVDEQLIVSPSMPTDRRRKIERFRQELGRRTAEALGETPELVTTSYDERPSRNGRTNSDGRRFEQRVSELERVIRAHRDHECDDDCDDDCPADEKLWASIA